MLLSSGWFGQRARGLAAQLGLAAELRFSGVAFLPGAAPPEDPRPAAGAFPASARVGALAWDALPGAAADKSRGPAWSGGPAAARAARSALSQLESPLLIVPAGDDAAPGLRERGERLLARLRAGEKMRGDEALEELARSGARASERQLEELAIALHAVARAAPGLRLALAPGPSPAALLTPERMALLCAELPGLDLGLWLDPADAECRAALGLPPIGAWLDRLGRRVSGVTLCDSAGGRDRVPPGSGTVDWVLLAEYLPREALRVLDLAPSYPEERLGEARALLAARRIR